MTIEEKKKKFNRILFKWHKDNYRAMPWRNTRDPYRILISEIMLQQTQVDRVREKYAEFLKAFPSVRALASASLGDVLCIWSGLGYNRRAKYLHSCANMIVAEYRGKFPGDEKELQKLPGIGPSTAAALVSFAFDGESPMIDTNIRRILIRVFFVQQKLLPDKELYLFAKSLISKGNGRSWNYAMLDIGATLCTARNHSGDCPLQTLHGEVDDFIYKKPQTKFTDSRRFYRGIILRMLRDKKKMTPHSLEQYVGKKIPDLEKIISDLSTEGLIHFSRGNMRLPK